MIYAYLKNWYHANIQIISYLFPDVSYSRTYNWIIINDFALPSGFNMRTIPLLIVWQGINGDIFNIRPDNFYVDKRLRLEDGNKPEHIIFDNDFNDQSDKNWARCSWHIKNWKPSRDVKSGHNALSILEGLYTFFVDVSN